MGRFQRFVGAFITGALVLGGIWYFRPVAPDAPSGTVVEAPRRGGQLVTTVRAEPRSFNRITVRTQSAELLSVLTQARLVRVNRSTFELEPWLAERWESSPDGLTHTLYLRDGLKWSDGTPLTAEDVVFSFRAGTDEKVSALAPSLTAGGKPITATAVDPRTVRVTFAGPSGPGLRMLDVLPILPRHKLESAYTSGTFAEAWSMQTPPADVVGAGPFVFSAYEPGQRVVLDRNPTTGAWRPTARRCRISTASCWKWCRIRTPSCCGCSRGKATCRRTRSARTTTCRCAVRRNRAR